MNPKVFISHASEDKERFVSDFATKLRAKGIDAWLDRWEMLPGDSLVQKIFEEGIKNAQAVIIVLSKNSINKPWVREELDASVVRRINGASKVIPIVIDLEPDEVPEVLKATLWVKIEDLNSYEPQFNRIVAAVYGQTDKPPIGPAPAYANTLVNSLPGLVRSDNQIMKLACEKAMELGHPYLDTELLSQEVELLGIPRDQLYESLEILDSKGYIEATRVIGPEIPFFIITTYGFEQYAEGYIDNYDSIVRDIVSDIVNNGSTDSDSISASLNQPHMLVMHVLNLLDSRGLLRIVREAGSSTVYFYNMSPELKRMIST